MPRTSGAAMAEALERLGFEKLRRSGSRIIHQCGARGCIVQMHSEMKIGTLARILRKADVSPDEFTRAI